MIPARIDLVSAIGKGSHRTLNGNSGHCSWQNDSICTIDCGFESRQDLWSCSLIGKGDCLDFISRIYPGLYAGKPGIPNTLTANG